MRSPIPANISRALKKIPQLSASEERDLFAKFRGGDRWASELLILSQLKFVISIARNYRRDGCPLPDYPLYPQYSCEMSSKRGVGRTDKLKLYESSADERLYMVIVDSPDPTEEWFRLSVNCCYTSSGCN